jgi:diadenosine tetraphosphate (Ap4A) HIT family hydrolase
MISLLNNPNKKSVMFEDSKLYVCLANYPITNGHTIVVWKKNVRDLHSLSKKDYEYLMNKIDETRNALLKSLKIKKVYLIYMDEAKHVHWHLIPRYNQKGFNVLIHKSSKLKDFSLVNKIKSNFETK